MNAHAIAPVISAAANELRDAYDEYGATIGQILFKLEAAILADAPELDLAVAYAKSLSVGDLRRVATTLREKNHKNPNIKHATMIVYCDATAMEREIFAALSGQQADEQRAERRNEEVLAGVDRFDYWGDIEDQRERANANL